MKKSELRQMIREEISKTLNEVKLPRKVENLIKQHNAKDIYDLVDILKKENTTIAKELNIKKFPFEILDKNRNVIYYESFFGVWVKQEYDSQGNDIYYENSNGFWSKREYDSKGNQTYYEDSDDYWAKTEYDSKGNKIYYENSDGEIEDNR